MAGVGNMNMWFSDSEDDEQELRRERTFRPRVNFDFEGTFDTNERFRLRTDKLTNLVQRLEPALRRATERNHALSAKYCVQVALHWLENGGQYHAVGDMYGISKATVCRILRQFVTAVNTTLFNELVAWPVNIEDVVQQFYELGGLPMVCGCVDGTLIKIDAPSENEEAFVDRHGNHSLNCMAVCGPDLKFYYVDANWPGRVHDARVLRNSSLYQWMQNGWRPIADGVLLGDSGYPLLPWLIPPTEHDPADVADNEVIDPRYSCEIFKCCATLCNFARTENDVPDFDGDEPDDEEPENRGAGNDVFLAEEEDEQQNPEEARIAANRLNELVRFCHPQNR